MTICETLKRLLSGVERITKNMNKNRALSIDSGTKEIAPPLPRDPMAGAAKDRLTVDRFPVLVERLRREEGGWSDHPKDNGGRTMFGVTEAMLTPAPLPKQDPADAPYHFCALASLCDDGPRAPEEG
jgi:hypothetical protein